MTDVVKIISGMDPLLVVFKDQSKARSYPVGYWSYDFGDSTYYGNGGVSGDGFELPADVSVMSSVEIQCPDLLGVGPDVLFNPASNPLSTHYTGVSIASGAIDFVASDYESEIVELGYTRYVKTQGSVNDDSYTLLSGISADADSCGIETCLVDDDRGNRVAHVFKGPGVYLVEQSVSARNTSTGGWQLSSSNFSGTGEEHDYYTVVVNPVCPCVRIAVFPGDFEHERFRAITITADDYSADEPSAFSTMIGSAGFADSLGISGVSGYAPFLKVNTFGTIRPQSFPITGAAWNWSDWFSDYGPSDVMEFGPAINGWPIWQSTSGWTSIGGVGCMSASGSHVYTTPGIYGVLLQPMVDYDSVGYIASGLDTARCEQLAYLLNTPAASTECIMLKEIPMGGGEIVCNDMILGFPTVASGLHVENIRAGSYPICQIDWDMGDGSSIISVSRYTSAHYDEEWTTVYPDTSSEHDPRNYIINHEYRRTETSDHPNGYVVSLTAYACNTNSSHTVSGIISAAELPSFVDAEGDLHLVDNRIFGIHDDTVFVFEGTSSNQTYIMKLGVSDNG